MAKILLAILSVYSCLLFTGCATNPVTGESQLMLVSPAQEMQMGAQYAPQLEKELGGRIPNSTLQNYVNNVGQNIARISHQPNLQFTYVALNHESINAMALPGGYIFITRGMLEKLDTEAQLAGILAHETAHVTAKHSAQAMSRQMGMDLALSVATENRSSGAAQAAGLGTQLLISLPYSRKDEHQADSIGMDYTAKAGYTPQAMIETMEILERENAVRSIEFLSTHPNPGNRKQNLKNQIASRNYPHALKIGREDYKKFVSDNLK
ncbi:MAG: M48 family metalloprotease [Planctomycetes bacterium]|nr:M48 family metalloprotease [Planctomycetota bacterium]